jgi:hypothetical protein
MPNPQNITKIPSARVALTDANTGFISREWFRFLNNIYTISGGSTLGVTQIVNGGTGADNASQARINLGAGSVTRVQGQGTVNGITLTGNITTDGYLTLGGELTNVSLPTQTIGVLPIFNGGTGVPATTIQIKIADFVLAQNEKWVINNKTGSTCTVTLPNPAVWGGRSITFKNLQAQTLVSASSNVAPIGSATPGTAILSATVGAWATLVSDGTNWVVMAS